MKKKLLSSSFFMLLILLLIPQTAVADIQNINQESNGVIHVTGRIGATKDSESDDDTGDTDDDLETIGVDTSRLPKQQLPKTGTQLNAQLSFVGMLLLIAVMFGLRKKKRED